ncbi:MAG: sigma-70 family RNA polymerase sigma factor [Planctomycetes bacterium]|nr:sigma-70 family RNA polymerase sigma factor [Planctomycetota bacterium]
MTAEDASPSPDVDLTSIAVRRAVTGDAEQLTWVVERFTPSLMASARQRLGARLREQLDAEDLVQEVWSITLPRLADLESRHGRMTPVLLRFLASVMWRCHAGMLRRHLRQGRREPIADSELVEPATGVVQRAIRQEATTRLLAALDELDDADRRTVILRGIEQVPNHEAALILGEPPNTVAKRYGRALAKLKASVPGTVFDELLEED